MTSKVLSFPATPNRSISGPRLSNDHTETRFPVTLWVAGWTFHSPIWNGGVNGIGAILAVPALPLLTLLTMEERFGVPGRLDCEGLPIL